MTRKATTAFSTPRPRSSRVFLETLGRFRLDLSLAQELDEIEGENDFFPLGSVPAEWRDERLLGHARAAGNYADICASE